MKRFYRILALLLIAAALLLAGCGERPGQAPDKKGERLSDPVTAESLMEVVGRRLWRQQSVEFAVQGSFDMAQDTGRGMSDLGMDVSFQGELITTEIRLHAAGNLGMNIMGMTMDFPLELYACSESDKLTLCVYAMEEWITESLPVTQEMLDEALSQIPDFSMDEETLSHLVLRPEKELLGDRECYRMDFELRGEEIQADLPEDLPADQVQGLEDLTLQASYWVDAQTILPVRMTAGMEGPIEAEGFRFNKAEFVVDFTGFGTVESITIPEEAFRGTGESNVTGIPL